MYQFTKYYTVCTIYIHKLCFEARGMYTYMGVTCTMWYSFVLRPQLKKYLFYITPYADYRDDPG